jgi:hypothetical protein
MTEAEWLAADNPARMVWPLRVRPWRKRCLFICASWSAVRDLLLSERSRSALELLEDLADAGPPYHTFDSVVETFYSIGLDESERAWHAPFTADGDRLRAATLAITAAGDHDEGEAEAEWGRIARELEAASEGALLAWRELGRGLCDLARCVFGNPLRPVPMVVPAWLAWNGGTVRTLAEVAYEERQLPEGTLDPAWLSLLADALEDAGCGEGNLLAHLRGPGPHVRGCWALDLILGKE